MHVKKEKIKTSQNISTIKTNTTHNVNKMKKNQPFFFLYHEVQEKQQPLETRCGSGRVSVEGTYRVFAQGNYSPQPRCLADRLLYFSIHAQAVRRFCNCPEPELVSKWVSGRYSHGGKYCSSVTWLIPRKRTKKLGSAFLFIIFFHSI